MNRVLTFSGWGQAATSLHNIAPEAEALDYLSFSSLSDAEGALQQTHYDMAIGWSLGGLVACHFITKQLLHCDKLVLLATPFEFDADTMYEAFKSSLNNDIDKTLRRFQLLIAKGHRHPTQISCNLEMHASHCHLLYWLNQLTILSLNAMHLKSFPQTLLIHGRNDTIIPVCNVSMFGERFDVFRSIIIDYCGHAPHLEQPLLLKTEIEHMMR